MQRIYVITDDSGPWLTYFLSHEAAMKHVDDSTDYLASTGHWEEIEEGALWRLMDEEGDVALFITAIDPSQHDC